MPEDRCRQLLHRLAVRMPSLVFDIMEDMEQPPPPPPGPSPSPNTGLIPPWCRCTNCRHMGTRVEEVCCNMLPVNCLSLRPVRSLYINHYCLPLHVHPYMTIHQFRLKSAEVENTIIKTCYLCLQNTCRPYRQYTA